MVGDSLFAFIVEVILHPIYVGFLEDKDVNIVLAQLGAHFLELYKVV
jgi:hypothetical protein